MLRIIPLQPCNGTCLHIRYIEFSVTTRLFVDLFLFRGLSLSTSLRRLLFPWTSKHTPLDGQYLPREMYDEIRGSLIFRSGDGHYLCCQRERFVTTNCDVKVQYVNTTQKYTMFRKHALCYTVCNNHHNACGTTA